MTKKQIVANFSLLKIAGLVILISYTTSAQIKQDTITNSSKTDDTTSNYEFGIDSIIISEDSEPENSVLSVNNSTNVSLSDGETSTNIPSTITVTTESDYDATEGYTEPVWETTSIDSGKEIYDAKERLNLLEARMKLLEDVNLVWWNNFREMGAPLPKKSI